MQIVIDISDDFIKDCDGSLDCVISLVNHKIDDVYSEEMGYTNFEYTILPKGHGRLIDADAFKQKICTYRQTGCGSCKYSLCCPEDAPTIIEADKEVK